MTRGRWAVVESATIPKHSVGDGEDRLLVTEDDSGLVLCAVVDGATDKSGRDYGGQSGGARAADCVTRVLGALPIDVEPAAAVDAVVAQLAVLRREWSIEADDPMAPAAVAAVLVPERDQVWRVGDVHVAVRRNGDWEVHPGDKALDRAVAGARAALLHCRLAMGDSVESLAAGDPGRDMVMPVLQSQSVLANRDTDTPFGYGVLDGRPVPPRYVEVINLGDDVTDVVLASDGYLSAAPTLKDAEATLAASLAADPLRIGEHAATKAVPPGASGYDDRTYVRASRRR